MPKKVEYARPFLMDLRRCGRDRKTKKASTDGHIIENLRCHWGSTTYELQTASVRPLKTEEIER